MLRRIVKYVALGAALLLLLAVASGYAVLRASLPPLDGTLAAHTLSASLSIERDALGIATIQAANRIDLAYGTGFVHGEDRFFQMDLSRRLAAGELSELFGEAALEQDKKARLFRFRTLAGVVLGAASPAQRALVAAYTQGINAGLASLRSRPWEYWLLSAAPVPWRDEDTVLVSYAMWWDLQHGGFASEILKRQINAKLGGAECGSGWKCALQYLYPPRTIWDSPNSSASAAVNTASAFDDADTLEYPGAASHASAAKHPAEAGSNNWALAGRLTTSGAALVASDMHLGLRVPTVWYRMRLRTTEGLDLNGVTLPGAPFLVAGSNTHVAWAFTNSYGKWLDVDEVACVAVSDAEVRTATESLPLTVIREEIRVRGKPSVSLSVRSGEKGLLFAAAPDEQRCWFARWLATVPAATNFNLQLMETAASVDAVLALAPSVGIPHQNVVVGDRDGHIAWTIFGRIPVASGAARLTGNAPWTSALQHPHLKDPPSGRLWTANARPIDDARMEALLGDDETAIGVGYDLGARAHQIATDLAALKSPVTPADMLHVQLDDRAVFLARWHALILELLDADALRDQPRRLAFKRWVAAWNARASVDSVGYRLVRQFHDETERALWQILMRGIGMTTDASPSDRFEQALWDLVSTRPPDKIGAEFGSWRELLLREIDATIASIAQDCPELARCTWGAHHVVRIRHPLSGALPLLAGFLDMPTVELPGDHDMPRVQDGAFGASERFAVSPGHEADAYLHMPGGQSGHPLSPYYRAGFSAWAEGRALPFLPGSVQHRLTLLPATR